jgi:predicted nucleic acid-binding protein
MVRDDLVVDRIAVMVPAHFHVEVGNAIRNALRPRRLTVDAARTALATLAALPIQTIPLADLLAPGFEAALHYDCALYDALYLALADQAGCPFIHADRRLHNTLAGRFPRELWMEDYDTR